MTVRVVLLDDQEMNRMGLRMVLESQPGIEIVDEADGGDTALDLLERVETDVVLMDVRMPRMNGVEATRRIREHEDAPKVLILTTFDLDEYAYDGLRAGASGFLLKDTPVEDVAAAIKHIHNGDAVVAPSTTKRLLDHFTRSRPLASAGDDVSVRLAELTPREHEVLRLIARGMSNTEIADELVLAEGTVKVHVGRILTKLGLRDRVQAVVLAYEAGLVAAGEQQ
ncbi:MAG: response regulator transcription factor [Nocardioidaceae bacterium]|nr:response regulator transcription factor [Nocardioidaceae bacterium]